MKTKKEESPEESLMETLLKYREARKKEEYIPLAEREEDRETLDEIFPSLETIQHKILDSRCFLEMGLLQEHLSDRFLADQTTSAQRTNMVAYLLRTLLRPVVFLSGPSTLVPHISPIEEQAGDKKSEEVFEAETLEGEEEWKFSTREFSKEDMMQLRRDVLQIVKKERKLQQWQKKLTKIQAEILSQMSASGEFVIEVEDSRDVPKGTTIAIVLQEEVS